MILKFIPLLVWYIGSKEIICSAIRVVVTSSVDQILYWGMLWDTILNR